MNWTPIWRQAITCAAGQGKRIGKDKTICFPIRVYSGGDKLRVRFCNNLGCESYQVGAMTAIVDGNSYDITLGDKRSFEIPIGGYTYSDEISVNIKSGDVLEIRMFFKNYIVDNNITEEQATLIKGDVTHELSRPIPMKKPFLVKLVGAYNGVPTIESVELNMEQKAKIIVAFGDSITAMSRWTKPLAKRLYEEYGSEYQLLNAGINGNCLLYESTGLFSETFGKKGVERFSKDVLDTENLSSVIFALGVNDVSYLNDKTQDVINFARFTEELIKITELLHKRGVRVIGQTITPRLGCNKFTSEMEDLRLKLNTWLRNYIGFDYLVDEEAVVAVQKEGGLYFDDRYHQGDHLHPNKLGGRLMAEAYDLKALTGK